ncbi:hypothetical protein GUY44_18925 [Pimelobacter simplex]|nr:hypothetical protein [Pimelobacter simplex]MCG8152567.1 hypothetical protein [Pimelobacter simplex]GEB17057.1 hypothetical protein NSI01_53720 [Pimelobacter simplex]SFM76900.1 hypothetical protein SAMN05421671_3432 [Pimelobacter simplex]
MGDPTPNPDPTPAPADPAPAPSPTPPADPANPPAEPDPSKGGKDAILADLAKERDKRQALETQVSEMQTAHQQQMDALAKALGLKKDDDAPPDPDALASEIATERNNARTANLQLAVFKAAGKHEANAARLLDSATFLASLKDVDPTDADAVSAAIETAVEADPVFKTTPAVPATPPFPGGPRPNPPARAGSLGEAIANRLAAQTH